MADYVLQFFEPTRMDMPTYLIAIIVSDFTSTASADSRSVKVSCFALTKQCLPLNDVI